MGDQRVEGQRQRDERPIKAGSREPAPEKPDEVAGLCEREALLEVRVVEPDVAAAERRRVGRDGKQGDGHDARAFNHA
jgi:hypothetical protein